MCSRDVLEQRLGRSEAGRSSFACEIRRELCWLKRSEHSWDGKEESDPVPVPVSLSLMCVCKVVRLYPGMYGCM